MLIQHIPVLQIGNIFRSYIINPAIISKITKWTLLSVIFPHGMTDIIHAKKYDNIPALLKINTIITSSCLLLHHVFKQEHLVHSLFMIASMIHFRNDMPLITIKNIDPKWIQLLFSIGLTNSFGIIPTECFIAFMTCVHTMNHYKMSWSFVKYYKIESFGYILGLGILLNKLSPDKMLFSKSMIVESTPLSVFVKSVVIGHIIYQELHVFSESKKVLSYCRKILENIWFLWVITKIKLISR